jgi:Spy/CpxP family protein refolding chaperone
MCAKLECTDDQKEELRAIFAEMRQDAKGDREAIERLRAQMKTEFAKDKPDEAKLRKLQEQISTHHKALASRRLDAMLDVHDLLDSGQRQKLLDMMEHRKHQRGEHRKGRRGKKPAKKAD